MKKLNLQLFSKISQIPTYDRDRAISPAEADDKYTTYYTICQIAPIKIYIYGAMLGTLNTLCSEK